jgi:hypothetical protein
MLKKAIGTVTRVLGVRPGAVEVEVEVDGDKSKAIAYTALVAVPEIGDQVSLNITAVALGLGTGGYHFIWSGAYYEAPIHAGTTCCIINRRR